MLDIKFDVMHNASTMMNPLMSIQVQVLAISVLAGISTLSPEQRDSANAVMREPSESPVFMTHAMSLATSLLGHPELDQDQQDTCLDVLDSWMIRH
jgi:hypothetical protein